MTLPREASVMTRAEFLAWETEQPTKHEFVGGEVFAMVGARQMHVIATLNIAALLKAHLRGRPCRALVSDMQLEVAAADAVFYPDVVVTCDPRDLRADRTLHHPTVSVEVLSENTAAYEVRQLSADRRAEGVRPGRPGAAHGGSVPAHGNRRLAAGHARRRARPGAAVAGLRGTAGGGVRRHRDGAR